MSTAALAMVLAVALVVLGIVLNHAYARLALVELALNEGLPPGHQPVSEIAGQAARPAPATIAAALSPGVHVFLSRNCHACQRLVDELDVIGLQLQSPIHLRYVDRPRPFASSVADQLGAELHADQADLAAHVAADPLPFTVAIGAHALVSAAVTPTVQQVVAVALDGGLVVEDRTTS